MLIRLDRTRFEPFQWREELSIDPAELGVSELLELGPVLWSGEVGYASPGYRLTADVKYEQKLACTRCLAPQTVEVDESFELLIVVDEENSGGETGAGGDHELSERDLGVYRVESDEVELRPILLEQIQLNIPMRVLCSDECRGLCPECGQNLNTASCDCAPPGDPRWGALAALRDGLKS